MNLLKKALSYVTGEPQDHSDSYETILTPTMKHEKFGESSKTSLELTQAVYSLQVLPKSHLFKQSTKMTFKNFANKTLEGELIFPLPDKATINGYSLDLNGVMVDAVIIEQQKAKKVFEEEVRSGKSVSVVEYVVGNCFKTKVYPIHANSTRTVQVNHFANLSTKDKKTTLDLPLEISKHPKLESLTVTIKVLDSSSAPKLYSGETEWTSAFIQKDNVYECTLSLDKLKDVSCLHVVVASESEKIVAIENNKEHGQVFFNISDHVEAVKAQKVDFKDATVALLWDASLSRNGHNTKDELSLLAALSKQGTFKIDLFAFSSDYTKIGTFTDVAKVIEAIMLIKYDGATNLNNVRKILDETKYDFAILMSDGLDNLADPKEGSFKLKKKTPIYSVTNASQSNSTYLEAISQTTGGEFYALKPKTDLSDVASRIGRPPFGFLGYEFKPEEISELTPSVPTQLSGGNEFHCSGVLLSDKAELTMCFGHGSTVEKRITVKLEKSSATDSTLLGTLWASRMISELSAFESNSEQILALGRKFSLVSSMTSFIFLESVDQFIKHDIVPPKSCTQLYNDYQNQLKTIQSSENDKTNRVLGWWRSWRGWYKTNYYDKWVNDKTFELKASQLDLKNKQVELENLIEELKVIDERFKKELEERSEYYKKCEETRVGKFKAKSDQVAQKLEELTKELKMIQDLRKTRQEESKSLTKVQNWVEPELPAPKPTFNPFRDGLQGSSKQEEIMSSENERSSDRKCKSKKESRSLMEEEDCMDESRSLFSDSRLESDGLNSVEEKSDKKDAPSGSENTGSIQLAKWSPDVPYLNELKKHPIDKVYEKYFEVRPENIKSPAFYLDVADYLHRQNRPVDAIRILTNTLELELESAQLIRVVAYKLEELGALNLAEQMFRRVLKMNPHEPQSYRDLALVLGKLLKYKESIQLLWKVVTGKWDSRFDEIEITALVELNRMIHFNDNRDIPSNMHEDFLVPNLCLDLRIIMAWDTDATDIDMHTHEPTGEHVYYGAKNSKYGGLNSRDFTQGYGPETYTIRNALPGIYKMKARYYANHQQSLTGGTTILLSLYTHYGDKEREKFQQITIRLSSNKDDFEVGQIEIKNEKAQAILDGIVSAKHEVDVINVELSQSGEIKAAKKRDHDEMMGKLITADADAESKTQHQISALDGKVADISQKITLEKSLNDKEEIIWKYEYEGAEPKKKGFSSLGGNSDFDIKL
jgi:Ca-activated chloride channel family protein